jgi:acyl-CoA synthetase (AMP-forming)/AMP-acid ligase II
MYQGNRQTEALPIAMMGPWQMRGFGSNPEATAERIVDGWVKTGDVGCLDPMATSTCSTVPTTW